MAFRDRTTASPFLQLLPIGMKRTRQCYVLSLLPYFRIFPKPSHEPLKPQKWPPALTSRKQGPESLTVDSCFYVEFVLPYSCRINPVSQTSQPDAKKCSLRSPPLFPTTTVHSMRSFPRHYPPAESTHRPKNGRACPAYTHRRS